MPRVLQVLSSLQTGGGIQVMLKNYYAQLAPLAFQTDFVVCGTERGGLEPWFEALGAGIHHIPPRSVDPAGNLRALRRILADGHYDVVHCHQDYHGAAAMAMAKRCGVPVRIIHSHQAYPPESALKRLRRRIESPLVIRDATVLAACGELAGAWLYGQDAVDSGRVVILRNAIDTEAFAFSQEDRLRLRRELSIPQEAAVIGHVGRFTEQKNHRLLLDIFAEFHRHRPVSVLLLAGDGPLRPEIERQADRLGLRDSLRFLGMRTDVPQLLSAMDLFLLPSRWEGLGIVAVEAQASGLPCVCSHKVPREVKLTDQLRFLPEESYTAPAAWCGVMEQALSVGRRDGRDAVCAGGYDIRRQARRLESLYLHGTLPSQEL